MVEFSGTLTLSPKIKFMWFVAKKSQQFWGDWAIDKIRLNKIKYQKRIENDNEIKF